VITQRAIATRAQTKFRKSCSNNRKDGKRHPRERTPKLQSTLFE